MKAPTKDEIAERVFGKMLAPIIVDNEKVKDVDTDKLKLLVKFCNYMYRKGEQIASDALYDHVLIAELNSRSPEDEFLKEVEPEELEGKKVKLPQRMLSTDKAYDMDAIKKWADRVVKEASTLGIKKDSLLFKVTPKLDGFAAYDAGGNLYTRGDGRKGSDITRAFSRGMTSKDPSQVGPGEIVVDKEFFEQKLSHLYDNSRNFISSVIKEGDWSDDVKNAVELRAVVFAPFSSLDNWIGTADSLFAGFDVIRAGALECGYDVDGIVIECVNEKVKERMGHTNHHHRWQIAFKQNTEFKDVLVLGLTPQTSKTGRITPVAELEPTKISGAELRRATCHHYGNVLEQGIGVGATVRVYRSGLVIPYIERVIVKNTAVEVPDKCPSCGSATEMDGDNLFCTNHIDCPAQMEGIIEYWFKTLGNCDGFGPKVIEKLCESGFKYVVDIYSMDTSDFDRVSVGYGVAANLIKELDRSQAEEIEDWRFLAAFSIHTVGKGGCERLLKHHRLLDIFDLTVEDFIAIDGFAEKTAIVLHDSLKRIRDDFDILYKMGFNLSVTPLESERSDDHPIAGKTIVFTGSMKHGKRDEMKKQAKALGATVGGSVSGKTDYLICGDKVGASKTNAAAEKGVTVITEDQYIEMLEAA